MSEKFNPTPEHTQSNPEVDSPAPEHRESINPVEQPLPEQAERQAQVLAEARKSAEAHSDNYAPTKEQSLPARFVGGQKAEDKKVIYRQTLKQLQTGLSSPAARSFSRFIHQRPIELVSELTAKTLFRPSLTLGAAMGAFVGGGIWYFTARYYGFALSGSEFLLSGVVGGLIGLGLEFITKLIKKVFKKSSD